MKQKLKTRDSSIELLRILTAIAVVFLHYNNNSIGGGFNFAPAGTLNGNYLYLIEHICVCAVDLFVLISAYFLAATEKRKLIKVVEMLIQVIVFRCAFYGVELLCGTPFSLRTLITKIIPSNYYVILYIVLYIISPYINVAVKTISKKSFKNLVIIGFLIFSVWAMCVDLYEGFMGAPTNGFSPVGMYGSQYGYSIVNFMLLYVIGAYIRINNVSISKKIAVIGLAVCVVLMSIATYPLFKVHIPAVLAWSYHNPLVIMMACFILLLFKDMKIRSKVVNEFAKASFTCYLFHGDMMLIFGIPFIKEAAESNVLVLFLHQIAVGVGFYLLSYVVYKVYHFCIGKPVDFLSTLCKKLDISICKDDIERF